MSETVNQETNENATNEQKESGERLFTQEEVNGFFDKRYSEMMSKLKEFEEKAQKYDEMEEANKSELQKAQERAEKLQTELSELKHAEEVRIIRDKVAKETGVPSSLLTGNTEEECTEQAAGILSFKTSSNYPTVKDGGEIQKTVDGSTRQQFAEWASQAFS